MPLLDYTPRFTVDQAAAFAKTHYGMDAGATPLAGERDQNFLLTASNGDRFVIKIANAKEDLSLLAAQNRVLDHLAGKVDFCPRVVPTITGDGMAEVETPAGVRHAIRLVTFMPGRPMARVRRHSDALLSDLGRCLGQMDQALVGFDHPGCHRDFHWDLARAADVVNRHRPLVTDPVFSGLVDRLAGAFDRHVVPVLPDLRSSVIHNDANDYNVIVGGGEDLYGRNQQVTGVIDFGDMVFSHTVNNLAITIAYAVLDKPDPMAAAVQVAAGYHGAFPLTEPEIAVLFHLICLRLCVSACMAAHNRAQRPDDPYLGISQAPIRNTLPRLTKIHPRFAEACFRHACGLDPVPAATSVGRWLEDRAGTFAPVLGMNLAETPVTVFDLGIGSPLVSGDPDARTEPDLTRRLTVDLQAADAVVGVGRYDEARMIYTSPAFAAKDGEAGEPRTVHLGLDLFAPAGTPVHAPLAGVAHAAADNNAPQDYGPVVILTHRTDAGETFHTLYGHLGRESLDGIEPGQAIEKGERIGTVGAATVNGGWTPHLHFQVIVDGLDMDCDFPGVARASERSVWTRFSPDPKPILGIPEDRFPPPAPTRDETLAARRRLIGKSLSIGYRNPVKVARGWRQYLFDDTGRRYLDAYNNVPHVGHCHPHVVAAAARQMSVLNTNTRYLHDFINQYAERLCATMPDPLNVCFFVNSASEGNELALRLARSHTESKDLIVLEAAYHGHTTSLIDISPYKHDGPGGGGAPDWVHTAPVADLYRGAYKADDPDAADKYALAVQDILDDLDRQGRGLAGFIAESYPSVGGQIILPDGYLADVYRRVRRAGGLCIADEVQTGYGRTGTHFYAFDAQGVVPDIVVLGKPIGNGHPISAVVTTTAIADTFNNGMEFFSTFGGNTVSCAVGMAVLDVLEAEDLQSNALRSGKRILDGMRRLKERYPVVGDVRGSGLFLGMELVRDPTTLEPAGDEAAFVADRMRDHGILLGTDGPFHNVVKIRPPMPFCPDDADHLVATLEKIMAEDFAL
jgi:4-aminobutyrate aminotransferase-like enzyme/Ser/Thr protein kinase RdoA (MazF antagonist)